MKYSKFIMIVLISVLVIGSCAFMVISKLANTDPYIIHVYNYESSDHGFEDSEIPEKGRTLEMVEQLFNEYKKKAGNDSVELRITTKIESWDDKNNRRWKYKYMEPNN